MMDLEIKIVFHACTNNKTEFKDSIIFGEILIFSCGFHCGRPKLLDLK